MTHFLGAYQKAYDLLAELASRMFTDQTFASSPLGRELYFDTVLLQSHIRKHQGKFCDAAQLLTNVDKNQKNLSWIKAHFSTYIFLLNEMEPKSDEWKRLLNELTQLMSEFRDRRESQNSEFFFYEAYYPIVAFYNRGFRHEMIQELIQIEDEAINFYEYNERRYVTNCYFIKAELLRIGQRWKEADDYYNRCYDIYCHNGDKDILYLVAIAYKCLQQFEGLALEAPFDCDKVIDDCKQQEENYGFHRRLISKMELAAIDSEFRKSWLTHYRTTINPIP